jgi:xanthine dehydrogenase accessory factor
MDNNNLSRWVLVDIIEEILSALEAEDRVLLATIISTSGSTPASALSKMLVKQEGIVSVGTVGGGCMEGDVLLHANRLLQSGKAEVLTFHLTEDDIEHGLICGGSLDVLIEPVTRKRIALFKELKSIQDAGEDCILATFLDKEGNVQVKEIVRQRPSGTGSGVLEYWSVEGTTAVLEPSVIELLAKVASRQETGRLKTERGEWILEPMTGQPELVIFGGGHVSRYVSRTAAMAGFRVTVVDDRDKFANPQRFPEAARTLAMGFLESFSRLTIRSSTYIVIVTRGHRYDEDVLEQALKTSAKYIGMIGSKRKVLTTYEHLVEGGVSTRALDRVYAPIGIDIGAVTAEEIGVSIVAELIKVRRGENSPLEHESQKMKEAIRRLGNKQPVG